MVNINYNLCNRASYELMWCLLLVFLSFSTFCCLWVLLLCLKFDWLFSLGCDFLACNNFYAATFFIFLQ